MATTDRPAKRTGVSPSPAAREVFCDAVVGEQDSDVCRTQAGGRENQITVRVTAATAFLPHSTAVCLQASGTLALRAASFWHPLLKPKFDDPVLLRVDARGLGVEDEERTCQLQQLVNHGTSAYKS